MLRSDNTVLSCCMIYLYHVKNKMLNNRNMFDNYSKILDINQQWITVQMIAFPPYIYAYIHSDLSKTFLFTLSNYRKNIQSHNHFFTTYNTFLTEIFH